MAGSGDCPLMTDSKDGHPGSPTNRPDEPPGGAGLGVGLRLGPVPGFPTSLAAASDQSPVTAERIADAFESFARKLAKAGVPLDRIPEGLRRGGRPGKFAHREDLMHKLQDTMAGWG